MHWAQTLKQSRRRTSCFYVVVKFPTSLLLIQLLQLELRQTQNKGDGWCIAVGLHSDSKQGGYEFVLFSFSLNRRLAFVQTWVFTQTPNADSVFRIYVTAHCNNIQRRETFCYMGFHSDS